jgi:probable phosphoglycerate mutase
MIMALTRLILWRHGQTQWNAQGWFQGSNADIELSQTGLDQARAAARHLASLAPDVLVSSPMARATQTCTAVQALTEQQRHIDPRLTEIDMGAWSGLTLDAVRALDPAWAKAHDLSEDYRYGRTGETSLEVGVRASAAMRDWAASGGTVLIVSHGLSIRMGVANLLGWTTYAQASVLTVMGNCAWSILTNTRRGWRLDVWNAAAG